jgi:hypothetical protein
MTCPQGIGKSARHFVVPGQKGFDFGHPTFDGFDNLFLNLANKRSWRHRMLYDPISLQRAVGHRAGPMGNLRSAAPGADLVPVGGTDGASEGNAAPNPQPKTFLPLRTPPASDRTYGPSAEFRAGWKVFSSQTSSATRGWIIGPHGLCLFGDS